MWRGVARGGRPGLPPRRPGRAPRLLAAGDRAAGRLDLPRRQPGRLLRLQAVGAEVQRGAALRNAVDTALMLLAVLGALGTQHDPQPSRPRSRPRRSSRRSPRSGRAEDGPAAASAARLSWAIGS